MHQNTKGKNCRTRAPIIILVCEGRNKTEKLYFEHFRQRDSKYRLIIKPCESTDISNMAKMADYYYQTNGLDCELGDHVFCLVDLDLSKDKQAEYQLAKNTNKNIEFILSNPCFEIWLLYYFTEHPRIENSSQKVKEQLKKYVPNYSESMDIVAVMNLYDKHPIAINRSEKKNAMLGDGRQIVERNPYTEVQNVLDILYQTDTK